MKRSKRRKPNARMKKCSLAAQDPNYPGLVIRWDLVRLDKPLDEITAADVPRGLDPDDVCALNSDGSLMLTQPKNPKKVRSAKPSVL